MYMCFDQMWSLVTSIGRERSHVTFITRLNKVIFKGLLIWI